MNKNTQTNIIFLFATIVVLVVSLAWIVWIEEIRAKWPVFKNPIVGETIYVLSVTLVGILFIIYFKPFSNSQDSVTTTGSERILQEVRDIRLPVIAV